MKSYSLVGTSILNQGQVLEDCIIFLNAKTSTLLIQHSFKKVLILCNNLLFYIKKVPENFYKFTNQFQVVKWQRQTSPWRESILWQLIVTTQHNQE